jgi:lysine-specific histone demethylase 1B
MDRRIFLKKSALISAGGLLLPGAFMSACRRDTLFENLNFQGKVLIIGAGAAGLYAGHLLKQNGVEFEILEAAAHHGGRLGKLTGFANFPIDLGAQWLHGKNNIVGDLIRRTNTKISVDDTEITFWLNNQLVNSLPHDINIFEGSSLPDISYQAYAAQQGLGDEYQWIIEGIAGSQGASASRLSVYYNNLEEENWNSGDRDYKFEETYFDLIDKQIAAHVLNEIRYETIVQEINYSGSTIEVTDQNGNKHLADKLIITVPLTILKSGDITFTPPLPPEKIDAFSKIGMDAGMKVFLKFSERFYDQLIAGGSVCAAYADDSVGKAQSDNVLLAFLTGDQAAYLDSLGSDEAVTAALLQELDQMYNGQASASFIASHVQNFTANPFIKGAYSYSTMGMGNARETAARSVNDKLFFAGEAMNINGHHQTVQGAVETGYREVINIFKSISK